MKLLFDHHLSPRLVDRLADLFPDSNHVYSLNLDEADDYEIWEFAKENKFTIITKDADFSDLSILRGFPPKIVWIRRGNCKTSDIESILRDNFDAINELENDEHIGMITLF